MYRFKNSLIAFAGMFALISLIALVTPTKGVGQSGKQTPPQDVRLVGTSVTQPVSASAPLPVEGSVNIANTPTVRLDSSANLVKIDAATPVSVREVDKPVFQPFQAQAIANSGAADRSDFIVTTVPNGKRLVIEHVSGTISLWTGQQPMVQLIVKNGSQPYTVDYFLVATFQQTRDTRDGFVINQPMRLYADPGTEIQAIVGRNDTFGSMVTNLSISGYLVDLPQPVELP